MEERIRMGVSACLLGQQVRYDGGHKHDRYITDILGEYLEFVAVCPEVEAGFSIPRETFRLVGDPENPRLVTTRSNVDHTERMLAWAEKRVAELEKENLCGFIFKSDSPNSGLSRVKVYNAKGMAEKKGVGLFARAFTQHFPLLPVEEEGRRGPGLHTALPAAAGGGGGPSQRRQAARDLHRADLHVEALAGDHGRRPEHEKPRGLPHPPQAAPALPQPGACQADGGEGGKLVAEGKQMPIGEATTHYEGLLIETLRLKTTVKKNMNVLEHILGYFKAQLSADEKQEMLEIFDRYRREFVPLIVPVTLLNHYVRKFDQPYLKQQVYLNPHPIALKLRNHV